MVNPTAKTMQIYPQPAQYYIDMPMLNRFRPLALATLVAASALAWSQDTFDAHCANIMLLTNRSVQTELKLTEAQRTKLNEHADSFNADMKVVMDAAVKEAEKAKKPPELPAARVAQLQERLKSRLVRVLTATQLRRLREISLQVAGYRAVADPVIARRLNLTAAQTQSAARAMNTARSEAAKLQQDADNDLRQRFGSRQPKTDREREAMQKEFQAALQQKGREVQTKLEAIDRRYTTTIQGLLTQAQRRSFESLKGRAFTIRPDAPPPRS